MSPVARQWRDMVLRRAKYFVHPAEFPDTVHSARTWLEVLEWVRCYPEPEYGKPRVFDLHGREVPYAR